MSQRGPIYFFEEYLAKPLVGLVLTATLTVAYVKFKDERETLLASAVSLVASAIWIHSEHPKSHKRRKFAYLSGLALFGLPFIFSWFSLAASWAAALAAGIVMLKIYKEKCVVSVSPSTGLAATSILLNEVQGRDHFVLIFNENLRGGAGLWVPPGGHFSELSENPIEDLIRKVRSEVGIDATPLETSTFISAENVDKYSTRHTTWWSPPCLLLNEDLHGVCSQGHSRHIDAIYLLRATGPSNSQHKYGASRRINIPIAQCITVQGATAAVIKAVEAWEVGETGKYSGITEAVSHDVPQRLHLAAAWLSTQQAPTQQPEVPT